VDEQRIRTKASIKWRAWRSLAALTIEVPASLRPGVKTTCGTSVILKRAKQGDLNKFTSRVPACSPPLVSSLSRQMFIKVQYR
jgi:hypothetical protein